MQNVMIDLETLGTQPGSVILSVGAVLFDPTKPPSECIGNELYMVIGKKSCEEFGLTTSKDTLEWWEKQSPEARKVLDEAACSENDLRAVMSRLSQFIPAGAKVWSNGANFDQPLLDVAYHKCGISLPWKYWNSRCYRTILALHPGEKSVRPPTVCAHNALEDAKWQAKHLVNIAQLVGVKI